MSLLAEIDWNRIIAPSDLAPVLFMAVAGIVVIFIVGVRTWTRTQQMRLKEKMIDRGFTPEEIVAVMNAGRDAGQGIPASAASCAPNHPNAQRAPIN